LREELWQSLQRDLPDLLLNGHPDQRLPGNLNVSIPEVDGAALLLGIQGQIALSSGSACSSRNPEPSHVLQALGRSRTLAQASLRFGLGRSTTPAEITLASEVVSTTVRSLRASRSAQFPEQKSL
jgi:cysteine desulfurase